MELWDGYAFGSSADHIYLITKQALKTGLIVHQAYKTKSEVSTYFDMRPSDVIELIANGRIIVNDNWFTCVQTPMVKA